MGVSYVGNTPTLSRKTPTHPWYIAPSQWWILKWIITYNNSSSIDTNTCLILEIILVCFNLTTQLSIVCVLSTILYK